MSNMRVYVGTYSKYNIGNLFGEWLSLEDYSDLEEFHNACKELHGTESDPEFMFQDFEGIPKGLVSESHIDELVFELAQLDDDDLEVFKVYRSDVDQEGTIEEALEAFVGRYDSKEDYAQDYVESSTDMTSIPQMLIHHIDWEGVAREMDCDGGTSFITVRDGVMVFLTHSRL